MFTPTLKLRVQLRLVADPSGDGLDLDLIAGAFTPGST